MKRIDTQLYQPDNNHRDIMISRLRPHDAKRYAQAVLRVLGQAYERQFEQENQAFAAGTARSHFNHLSAARVETQRQRMETYMANGSTYWVARGGRYAQQPSDIVGVAKVSPSRPGWRTRLGITPAGLDNCYVNDVAVTKPREGIGSALLYTALSDFADRRRVIADVMPGSEAFFEATGLRPNEPQPGSVEAVEVGEYAVTPIRYEALGVAAVRAALADQKPWLDTGDATFG